MNRRGYLLKEKESGFETIDEFVRCNLHYLPEERKQLFYAITNTKEYSQQYYQLNLKGYSK